MPQRLEDPVTTDNAKWWLFGIFCLIWVGLNLTEQISIHLLSPTIQDLTRT